MLVLLGLLLGGCQAIVNPVATVPAVAGTATSARDTADLADQIDGALRLVERAFRGQDAQDIVALLQSARSLGDDEQRFQALLGAWQLMRLAYHQQGETVEQKAALDAVEAIAARSRFYQKDLFQLKK